MQRSFRTEILARETLVPVKDHFVHPTAVISPEAHIGAGTRIWAYVQIREGARIGRNCMIGNGVYIDKGVIVGDDVNLHNKTMLYKNVIIEDAVFIGPGVVFTNDPWPRANVIRVMERESAWYVRKGASIGANTTLLPHVNVGRYAMVGADSLVTRDVPDHALVYGSPARVVGFVSKSGRRLRQERTTASSVFFRDPESGQLLSAPRAELQASAPERTHDPGRRDPLSLAISWVVGSGIQSRSRDPRLEGGVAGWYEVDTRLHPFLYSEITGYAITALLFLQRTAPQERLAPRAHAAAGWLLRNAITRDGAVRTRLYLAKHHVQPQLSFEGGNGYAFDAGMIAYGLIQLFKVSKRVEYRNAAERVLGFLLDRLARRDGTFTATYRISPFRRLPDAPKWSLQSAPYHAKIALGLIDAWSLGWGERYRRAAVRLLDAHASRQQGRDGRFITDRFDKSTYSHPLCYAIEGFLCAGRYFGRKDYVEVAQRAFDWLSRGVGADGAVPTVYRHGAFTLYGRSDVQAQYLRVGTLLCALGPSRNSRRLGLLEAARQMLESYQYLEPGPQQGGFVYGTAPDGLSRLHLNAWATFFAAQAIWCHEHFIVRRGAPELEGFI